MTSAIPNARMQDDSFARQVAVAAAALIVDEGVDWSGARQKAGREVARREGRAFRPHLLPDNEALEDAVREHIELFCADTQAAELAALRATARRWMERLAEFRPHLAGAVWRGTATARSAVQIDLFADDTKAPEIALLNAGIDFDTETLPGSPGARTDVSVLICSATSRELDQPVTLHLHVHDYDALRGALKADAQGRSWRGDLAALDRLLATEAGR
jgi:hypothetical protein